MALTDIVWYPSTWDMEEARGNGGTLIDIIPLNPNARGDKIMEEARGTTVITDIVTLNKDIELPAGSSGGGETSHVFFG